MIESPQKIQALREGVTHEATVSWWAEGMRWAVSVESSAFGTVEARADDAFEALCQVRAELEPSGWRLGVTGALAHVWPSGMARDQGGGLRAYRMTAEQVGELVDTFAPVDPATVSALAEQRAEVERLFEEIRRHAAGSG